MGFFYLLFKTSEPVNSDNMFTAFGSLQRTFTLMITFKFYENPDLGTLKFPCMEEKIEAPRGRETYPMSYC